MTLVPISRKFTLITITYTKPCTNVIDVKMYQFKMPLAVSATVTDICYLIMI